MRGAARRHWAAGDGRGRGREGEETEEVNSCSVATLLLLCWRLEKLKSCWLLLEKLEFGRREEIENRLYIIGRWKSQKVNSWREQLINVFIVPNYLFCTYFKWFVMLWSN